MKLHHKGFLLVELSAVSSVWDSVLIEQAMCEYGFAGRYWANSLRVCLDELASAGLISCIDSRFLPGPDHAPARVSFCYRLSEFGRRRMRDTGLLPDRPDLPA